MGFLDFLKKEKPAPAPMLSPKRDDVPLSTLPQDPSAIDWTSPPAVPKEAGPSMPINPVRRDPIPPELDHEETDYDKIPLPPVNAQDLDFLDSAAADLAPPPVVEKIVEKPIIVEKPVERIIERVVEKPVPPPMPSLELPDFSDEDMAELELPKPPTTKVMVERPIVEPPANAVAIPPELDRLDDIKLATGETAEMGKLEPTRFISSDAYFMILADVKAMRKQLRQNDEVIKDSVLRHEQLDQQYKRVALDMNAVQESLIKIDAALFE